MTTKKCFKCHETKSLDLFYKHNRMADGHLNKCKECTKSDVHLNRHDNLEYYQAYDRSRGNLPHRVAARMEYQKTDAYKESHRKANEKYMASFPLRNQARTEVGNALRDGRLIAWPTCAIPECCGKPQGHHPDYSRPLDVVWLCTKHHAAAHKMGREIERQRRV